ncbi:MAG: lysophospholipid acyltransferase family protein [Thermomicrobiales bacterium]
MNEDVAERARVATGSPPQAQVSHAGVGAIGRGLFRLRFEIEGREHVPPGEPLIVAGAPHRNWIDGFLLILALPAMPRIVFVASRNGLFNTQFKRVVLALFQGFAPVTETSVAHLEAIETALAVLKQGGRLGIFPEGGKHLEDPPESVGSVQRGVAFLAQQSGRRTLPVAIAGAKPLWRGKTLRVRVGAPIDPPPPDATKQEQQAWADALRQTLDGLIPPQPPLPVDGRMPWPWLTTIFD